jgi:hypothetical protein
LAAAWSTARTSITRTGIRSDNDPGNLELWLVMQPTGQRVEDLMKYIAEYHAEAMRDMLAGESE